MDRSACSTLDRSPVSNDSLTRTRHPPSGASEERPRDGSRRRGRGRVAVTRADWRRPEGSPEGARAMFHGASGAVCSRACPLARSAGPTVPRYSTYRGGFAVVRETRPASLVIAGNQRFPACSQNASRSDDIAGLCPASGQHPQDSGTITRERRSLERRQEACNGGCSRVSNR